ncbi:MAG: site-specific integrase [Actinomycetota bacterium]
MQHEPYAAKTRRLVKTGTPGIYKRGDRYVVVFRDPQGKERKRFARTLAEAREVKAALTADVRRGEYRTLSRVTFAEYATEWIEGYQGRTSRGLREATRDDYRRTIEREAVPFFGRMRLAEIEPRDVKRYAAHVAGRGVSPNTVRLAVAPVKALLATAVEEGLLRSNPSAGVRIAQAAEPEAEGGRVKALTEDELRALLTAVAPEWQLLVTLLAQTGLRVSEAPPLTWGDVDFGRRRLGVRRSLSRGRIGPPKTRHGRRDVPLSEGLARALWNARKAAGADAGDDASIFHRRNGELLDRAQVFRAVKAAAKRAGIPWAGLHTPRHTAATILFRRGLNAKQVQMWLGHHSPAFTLATYVHLLPDDLPDPQFLDELTPGHPTKQIETMAVLEQGAGLQMPDLEQTDDVRRGRQRG